MAHSIGDTGSLSKTGLLVRLRSKPAYLAGAVVVLVALVGAGYFAYLRPADTATAEQAVQTSVGRQGSIV